MTYIYFSMNQACAATACSHTAEVSGLKKSLERAEEKLGRVKKQLEDKQGMLNILVSF